MADNSGFPHCTKWKNYRYPLTRLLGEDENSANPDYNVVTKTGHFNHISGDGRTYLDIWLSDDWFLHSDALGITYKIVMYHDTADSCKTIQRPAVFVDDTPGTSALTVDPSSVDPFFLLGSTDNYTTIDVESSAASTLSKLGNAQTLYTIIPGLHFGFRSTSSTGYGDDNEFSWTMNKSALDGLPKVMDNTYTCWYKTPEAAGDTVVTEPLPSGIGNRSFNLLWNSNSHTPKRDTNAPSWGNTIYLEGSIDKVNWFTIRTLIDDSETLTEQGVHFDSDALDGNDGLYKRLKIEYETGGTPCGMFPHQYIQLAITPN